MAFGLVQSMDAVTVRQEAGALPHPHRRHTVRRLRACLGAAAAVGLTAAGTTALIAGNASGPPAPLSNRWYAAAPYLMPLDNDPPDPAAILHPTGLKPFQLAHALAPTAR